MLQRDVVAYKGLLADTYTLGELKDPSAVIVFVPGRPETRRFQRGKLMT